MKKAVQYGAGNIGRGFIGQLLSQSGYEVVFVDVNTQVVDKMNEDKSYPIRVVSGNESYEIRIENVRAVNGMDLPSVAEEISEADIMATAVGVNILPGIAVPIAEGLKERWRKKNGKPLNIIICENLLDANHYLKELIKKELNEEELLYLDQLVGFVEASIGRMVPVMTPELQEGNILRVCVEEYAELPVDKDGFKGEIPDIRNMIPFSPFDYYIQRKLFIHNMGHAITAYLGYLKGCRYIWEAISDRNIREISRSAMLESACALSMEHGIALETVQEHVEDLIRRFGNRQLNDTVERVGRDLKRKLSPNDRIVGALNLCMKEHIEPRYICKGLAAALHFKDPLSGAGSVLLDLSDPEEVLEKVCGMKNGSWEWNHILKEYKNQGDGSSGLRP
jgi:mannitol-1-phosphate 5-dehydrogenase